ncbi:MAG: 50S ribosomal protein L10 [Nitrospinae bacterium]|nr:50S ribosomal protein L10 [Nitrospinota bacterium]
MPTPAKDSSIKELNDKFSRAKSAVVANYQGITAPELTLLRKHMRQRSVDFLVVKNTLARKAAKNTSLEVLDSHFKGPVSLVVSYDDVVAPAKALTEFAKADVKKQPEVICGVVEGKRISPDEVKALSDLPSKEVLIARMLSTFQGPTTNFARVLNGLLQKLVGTLEAIKDKKEKSGG